MGIWGYGPFDNDAASVWCEDLEDAARKQRPTMFRELFKVVLAEEEYLDITLASEAIAAAAVVASLLPGGEEIESGFDLDLFGDDESANVPDDLPKLARKALDRVFGDNSEWMEQWKDDGDLDEAMAELEPLREVLGA
jgi:hypothetical protein